MRFPSPKFFGCFLVFLYLLGSGQEGKSSPFPPTPLHDFHTSLAELNYNPDTKSFEVSLRVFTDDFEKALSQANQLDKFYLDKGKKHNALIESYLKEHFYLLNAKNQKEALVFYGKEMEADITWLYFEISVKKSLKGYQIHNSMFTEVFADQINMVNFFYLKAKKTYLCTRAQIQHSIDFE